MKQAKRKYYPRCCLLEQIHNKEQIHNYVDDASILDHFLPLTI